MVTPTPTSPAPPTPRPAPQQMSVVRAALMEYWRTVVLPNPNQVKIGRENFSGNNPNADNFAIFVEEMEILTRQEQNPYLAGIIARGAKFVWDAVRLVNEHTTGGYGGAMARSTELVVNPLTLRDTGSAGGYPGTNPSSTWVVNRTATGTARLYPAANSVNMVVNSIPRMAHVILAWLDPVEVPKAQSVQLQQTDVWPEEFFNWGIRGSTDQSHIFENKQPWITRPGNSYRINVRYGATGEDQLQPIGFSIMRAQDVGLLELAS